jgi:hypothetical protein
MVIFLLPLGVRLGLLARLCRSHVARDIRPRTIATIISTLVHHFEHFMGWRAREQFSSVTVADVVWA